MDDVALREVTRNDLQTFYLHQLNPEAIRMAAFPARDKDSFMTHWTKILADRTVMAMTILFNGQVTGNIVSWEQEGRRLIGYWLGKDYWGKGIATRALKKFLVLVKPRPVYARVAKHNIGSIRVLEKCGFSLVSEHKIGGIDPDQAIEELVMELR